MLISGKRASKCSSDPSRQWYVDGPKSPTRVFARRARSYVGQLRGCVTDAHCARREDEGVYSHPAGGAGRLETSG